MRAGTPRRGIPAWGYRGIQSALWHESLLERPERIAGDADHLPAPACPDESHDRVLYLIAGGDEN